MNRLYIVGTAFVEISENADKKTRYGYRIFADNFMAWESGWTTVPANDINLLEDVVVDIEKNNAPNGVKEQFKRIIETEGIIVINGNEYTYVLIDDILSVLQGI